MINLLMSAFNRADRILEKTTFHDGPNAQFSAIVRIFPDSQQGVYRGISRHSLSGIPQHPELMRNIKKRICTPARQQRITGHSGTLPLSSVPFGCPELIGMNPELITSNSGPDCVKSPQNTEKYPELCGPLKKDRFERSVSIRSIESTTGESNHIDTIEKYRSKHTARYGGII